MDVEEFSAHPLCGHGHVNLLRAVLSTISPGQGQPLEGRWVLAFEALNFHTGGQRAPGITWSLDTAAKVLLSSCCGFDCPSCRAVGMAREEPPGPWGLALLRSLCPTELWIEDLPQSFGLRISEAIQLQPETVFSSFASSCTQDLFGD